MGDGRTESDIMSAFDREAFAPGDSALTTAPPIIDVTGLSSPVLSDRAAVARAVGDACRRCGFFHVVGHAIDEAMIRSVFDASRRFFALPLDTKRTLARRIVGDNRGYVDWQEERLDVQSLPQWRSPMLAYYDQCLKLGTLIHRAFSLDLGLPEEFFADKLDCPMATLRLLHYPAQLHAEMGLGAGAHTDYGNLTLLIDNGVAGLQLRPRDGDWIDAPPIPGAFICNVGDCLMRWSNDRYVSTSHRVLPPRHERYSIAFFLDPNADAVVEPIVAASSAPAKYPPIAAAAFLKSRLNPTYGN